MCVYKIKLTYTYSHNQRQSKAELSNLEWWRVFQQYRSSLLPYNTVWGRIIHTELLTTGQKLLVKLILKYFLIFLFHSYSSIVKSMQCYIIESYAINLIVVLLWVTYLLTSNASKIVNIGLSELCLYGSIHII